MKTLVRAWLVATLLVLSAPGLADATHAWGPYHWARRSNPFTIVLNDAVSRAWDASLLQAAEDWGASRVLDTTVRGAASANVKSCKPPAGQVLVCSSSYGNNGWLGIASISVSGVHITKAFVKLNDVHFAAGSTYDSAAWRNYVVCQEVGHTFGLDHQDEDFDNEDLNTCMDYDRDPASNQHPNRHDYQQLAIIYRHLDSTTTVSTARASGHGRHGRSWGRGVGVDADGRANVFVRRLDGGRRVVTFVLWAP